MRRNVKANWPSHSVSDYTIPSPQLSPISAYHCSGGLIADFLYFIYISYSFTSSTFSLSTLCFESGLAARFCSIETFFISTVPKNSYKQRSFWNTLLRKNTTFVSPSMYLRLITELLNHDGNSPSDLTSYENAILFLSVRNGKDG